MEGAQPLREPGIFHPRAGRERGWLALGGRLRVSFPALQFSVSLHTGLVLVVQGPQVVGRSVRPAAQLVAGVQNLAEKVAATGEGESQDDDHPRSQCVQVFLACLSLWSFMDSR